MRYYINSKIIICFCFGFLALGIAQAQPNDNSPFARLGIGNFLDQNFLSSSNMGGLSAAYYDPYQWNPQNPASLGYLKYTSFNVAAHIERSNLLAKGSGDDPVQTKTVWNGNINYLSLGMPLRNSINVLEERKEQSVGVGMGISLLPFTRTGQSTRFIENDPLVGTIEQDIIREGGTYNLMWSGGARYQNIAAGINVGYLFGTLERSQVITLPDDPRSSVTVRESSSQMSGLSLGYSAMYTLSLDGSIPTDEDDLSWRSPKKSIVFGINGRLGNSFVSKSSRFDRVIHGVGVVDTFAGGFLTNVKENGKLGSEITFGITYRDNRRLIIGSNFMIGQWSNYKNESDPQDLNDSWRWSVGGTWRPDPDDVLSIWNRMGYQAGFYTGRDPRSLSGEQLSYWGVTAGIEIPVYYTQQISHLSLGFEYGQVDSPVIKDNFFRFTLGMTFNDNKWFLKRKYD